MNETELLYMLLFIDDKLQYVLSIMHQQPDTIQNNPDFQKAYITLNDCLCKLDYWVNWRKKYDT